MEALAKLPAKSAHCAVTSTPYLGKRDYGMQGQIGLEADPAEFVGKLVAVFRELRRVLRDDGTLWLNIGDSYAGSWGAQGRRGPESKNAYNSSVNSRNQVTNHLKTARSGSSMRAAGIKPKDLIGIPWMLAFALRDDGWFLRQEIIWSKPNPMPESIQDRCTTAHESIFLLSKSRHYYFDTGAISEPVSPNTHLRLSQDLAAQIGSERANAGTRRGGRAMKAVGRKSGRREDGVKNNDSFMGAICLPVSERNRRSVWTVPTRGFDGEFCTSCQILFEGYTLAALRVERVGQKKIMHCACGATDKWVSHFATFPPALIRPCILAGSPENGVVIDPFGGAGTTGLVANREHRHGILIDINPVYAEIARQRIHNDSPLFSEAAQ